jgi:hypothetical protein
MKYLGTFTIICILGLFYSSCVKKANYPDVPVISYNNFFAYGSGSITDSALLLINFTDGNGNIGYSQQLGAPIDLYIVPLIYVYATNTFQPIIESGDTALTFPYSIPNITPSGSDKELNGIIQVNFENFIQEQISSLTGFSSVADIHRLQFKVWMYDNAGNKSNVLITPTCHTYPE